MKRSALSFFLILSILLSLAACGGTSAPTVQTQPTIATTAPTIVPTELPTEDPTPEAFSPVVVTITTMDHSLYSENGLGKIELLYDLAELSGGDPAAVDSINQILQAEYDAYREEISTFTVEELLTPFPDQTLYYTISCRESYMDDTILSLHCGSDWMMGGVHNYIPFGYTFDLTTGQQLGLEELFPSDGAALLEHIKNCIRQYLSENDLYNEYDDQEETISGYTLDSFDFYISESAELVICIPVYELGPGAAGSFTIPTGIYLGDTIEVPAATGDIQVADFLGQPVSALLEYYGNNYFQDNFSGSTYLKFGTSPAFFIGYCTDDVPEDALVRQLLASSPCTLVDNIKTSVTYPELVQMVGSAVTLEEPKYIFNDMEEYYEYVLSFDYQNYHFYYAWYDDPMTTSSQYIYLYRLDLPTTPY